MLSLGLSLWSSTILGRGDPYAVLGIRPELVFDFEAETYRTDSAPTSFSSAITHSASSNATMVDSDGLLKWRPHNLALNSATPATQSITVVSGADYTVECTGVSIALSGAGTGTVTEGNPVTITASTTTLTLTVTGSSGTMWAYRSDLGGMVNNPDRGDSYVPTTSSAVYLPRRGHHIWDGSQWVNEGLLHESEARTNLITYSEDLSNAAWLKTNSTATTNAVTAPDGNDTADKLVEGTAASSISATVQTETFTAGAHSFSVYLKAAERGFARLLAFDGTAVFGVFVNLSNGTLGATTGTLINSNVTFAGNGWYRVSISFTASAGNGNVGIRVATGSTVGTDIYTGDGASGIYVWGAHLEEGPTLSSYIPTESSTATRGAESLSIAAANVPYSASGVSIQMQGRVSYEDEDAAAQVSFWDWSSSDGIFAFLDTDAALTGRIRFRQIASGTPDQVTQAGALSPGLLQPFNIASRNGPAFINGAVSGTALTADTTPVAMPAVSGDDFDIGVGLSGTIKSLRIWAADIGDAGIEEATS